MCGICSYHTLPPRLHLIPHRHLCLERVAPPSTLLTELPSLSSSGSPGARLLLRWFRGVSRYVMPSHVGRGAPSCPPGCFHIRVFSGTLDSESRGFRRPQQGCSREVVLQGEGPTSLWNRRTFPLDPAAQSGSCSLEGPRISDSALARTPLLLTAGLSLPPPLGSPRTPVCSGVSLSAVSPPPSPRTAQTEILLKAILSTPKGGHTGEPLPLLQVTSAHWEVWRERTWRL